MSARFPAIKNSAKRDFRELSRPGIEPLETRIAPAALAHNIDLSSLDGTNGGFKLSGGAADDHVGASVSNAGDVNGDGLDDVIIGSAGADEGYVVFGSRSGFPADLDLSTLDGTNGGFKLQGGSASRASTIEVSAAGDFNGDGYADLIIGIKNESPNERLNAGESYLVFGKSSGFGTVDLLSLDGTNGGFRIYGANSGDRSGASVSAAGDFNGDGFDDLVIGAYRASNYSNISSGESYLLFGKPSGFATVDLAALNGSNGGFKLRGGAAYDSSGFSVSGIGDFNGDGLADIVIGAREADPSAHIDAGQSYVVFGKKTGFGTVELASLDGTNGGFALDGANSSDHLGHSVSGAGDVNGDGFDDLIVGAPAATSTYEGAVQAGVSYVVFGKASGFNSVKLSSLDGTNGGFIINGGQEYTQSGFSVSGAGDIDGDGFDDLIIGAPMVASGSDYPGGQSFLLFGKSSGFSTVELALLGGSNGGFKLNGGAYGDHAGHSVSGAGDFNGDGLDDIIIGANEAVANDHSGAGKSYIVFGFQDPPPNVTYPDLTITQFTDNKTSAAVRDTLAYNIDFFNAGTEDASGVTLIQTLPQGTYFNPSENSGWVQNDNNLIYYVDSLGAGTGGHAALVLHVYNTAEAGIDELVSKVSIVDDGSHGTSPTLNNTATDTDTLNAAPDLQLSVTKSGKTEPGNTLSYSLGYLNVGDQDATNVFITEKVPVGTTFDPSASTAGWVETARGSGIYQFALGTVYAGAGIPSFIILEEGPSGPPSVVFAVNDNNPAHAGIEQFTNEAAIDDDHANGPDPDLTNNSISDTSTLDAAPDLAITLHSDGVGTAHPGDTLIYTIGYANQGNQIATGVTIVETLPAGTRFVASENPGWTLNGSTLTYNLGSVAPQSITTLFENFDNNAVNTLPAGWNTFASGSEVWTTVTPTSSSSPNSAFAPNTSEASDLSLVSPTIHLSGESGQQLSFKNRFNIENSFDGAVLEISIDGGAFNDILDAGGSFAAGGYTDTVSSEFDNSIGGRQAWSGNSGGFINSVVNLPAASLGHDVQFRWRIASDSSISYEGWNIDDVAFTKPAPASTLALTLHVDSPAGPGLTRIISKATISDDGTNGLDPTADNSNTDTDVLSATADLSVSISDGGVTPVPGGNLAYTLNYANTGDRSVTGVKLKQTLPAGTTFDPTASTSGWTQVFGGTYEYDLGTLNGGGTSGSVAFVVHVTSPAAAGLETLSTTVSIDSSQEDPANGPDGFPSDNIASKTTPLNAAPDLRLLATDNGNPGINPGDTVVYALKYSNAGNQHTAGVVISEAVPAGTSFNPSASTPGWTTGDGIHYTFPVGTLNAGDNGSVNFALTANNPYTNGNSISDTAAIDDNHASGLDANPADNSSTDTTPILLGGDLSITKTDGVLTAVPGALVTYTITVGNSSAGAQTAFNTKVTDAFPASLTGVTYTASGAGGATGFTTSGGGNINDIVALPVGSTITYIVKGTLLASATGNLVNTATVTPDPSFTDNNPLNNSATDTDTLTPQADLQITKTDGKTSAVPGTANTYTIVVTNSGPSDVSGATIADTFPGIFGGVTYTATQTGGASGFSNGSGNLNQVVNLPSGSTITYTVLGTISAGASGTLSNTATITAPA
ncbi:MAG: Ca2+-binding protein toxin-related, partial [Chthoniobacteraceae bacterium]|nr:Ca2+-binding protein toxin-related [Chthoniobacteraceae bacterium]